MSVTFYITNHFWHHYQNTKAELISSEASENFGSLENRFWHTESPVKTTTSEKLSFPMRASGFALQENISRPRRQWDERLHTLTLRRVVFPLALGRDSPAMHQIRRQKTEALMRP